MLLCRSKLNLESAGTFNTGELKTSDEIQDLSHLSSTVSETYGNIPLSCRKQNLKLFTVSAYYMYNIG